MEVKMNFEDYVNQLPLGTTIESGKTGNEWLPTEFLSTNPAPALMGKEITLTSSPDGQKQEVWFEGSREPRFYVRKP